MGKQIYLSDKEIKSLTDTVIEWISMMEDGDETVEYTTERLNNGLGSALYKLYKGSNGADIYKKYIKK